MDTVPAFSGTEDCQHHIIRFEALLGLRGADKEKYAAAFPLYLSGTALTWYESLASTVQTDYQLMKGKFLQRFGLQPGVQYTELGKLFRLSQGTSSVQDFAARVAKTASQLDVADKDKLQMQALISGLQPKLRAYVVQQSPSSLEAAIQAAVLAETSYAGDSQDLAAMMDVRMGNIEEKVRAQLAAIDLAVASLQKPGPMRRQIPIDRRQPAHPHYRTARFPAGRPTPRTPSCFRCGGKFHKSHIKTCPALDRSCFRCNQKGHFANVCQSSSK